MKYLLDTCTCVDLLRGDRAIALAIENAGTRNCHISEITKAELLVGVRKALCKGVDRARPVADLLDMLGVIPVSNSLEFYAEEKIRLQQAWTPIEDFDLLIGCTAVCEGLVLVTDNVRHMERISGIRMENWSGR